MQTRTVTGVRPEKMSRARVAHEFRALLEAGARLLPAGRAKRRPSILIEKGYVPRAKIRLFDVSYYLCDYRYDEALGFFVTYVVVGEPDGPGTRIYPRIVYKDSSLLWRVATHYIHDEHEYWIGKGDVRVDRIDDDEVVVSVEQTADLPYEIQTALDQTSRRKKRIRDDDAVELVLREAPSGRLAPYADFLAPRREAAKRYRINRGKSVARFTRTGDPSSLRFVKGFEPDFENGVLETDHSASTFFGGVLRKVRILSTNRKIQYLFIASPTHAWVNPPQALTTELSSYGVRTVDVHADDDLFVPGYDYHHVDETTDPSSMHSQIPEGYVGEPHPLDPSRADASRWLDELPVIREFRRRLPGV